MRRRIGFERSGGREEEPSVAVGEEVWEGTWLVSSRSPTPEELS